MVIERTMQDVTEHPPFASSEQVNSTIPLDGRELIEAAQESDIQRAYTIGLEHLENPDKQPGGMLVKGLWSEYAVTYNPEYSGIENDRAQIEQFKNIAEDARQRLGKRGSNDFAVQQDVRRAQESAEAWRGYIHANRVQVATIEFNDDKLAAYRATKGKKTTELDERARVAKGKSFARKSVLGTAVAGAAAFGALEGQDVQPNIQAQEQPVDQATPTLSPESELLRQLAKKFDQKELINDGGELAQVVEVDGVQYKVKLTASDIQELRKLQDRLRTLSLDSRYTAYVVVTGKDMLEDHRPTQEAQPTKKASEAPPVVTASPTGVPSVEPTRATAPVTPTATNTGVPTERPTATEQGPMNEVPLKRGMLIAVRDGSGKADYGNFINGGEEVPSLFGLNFSSLTGAHFSQDKKYVEGTLDFPLDDPQTTELEQKHTEQVIVEAKMFDQNVLEQVRPFDPEKDSDDNTVYVWVGENERVYKFLGTGAIDGSRLPGGAVDAGFNAQRQLVINIDAFASGPRNNSSKVSFVTYGNEGSTGELTLEFVAGTNNVNIRNSRMQPNQSSNQRDEEVPQHTNGGKDFGRILYTTEGGPLQVVLDGDKIVIDGKEIILDHALDGDRMRTELYGDGDRRPTTVLNIKSLSYTFTGDDGNELRQAAENSIPYPRQIGDRAGVLLIGPILSEGLASQIGLADLATRSSHYLSANSTYRLSVDNQNYFEDKGNSIVEVLKLDETDEVLETIIKSRAGGIVQMSDYGTSTGPSSPWFKPDGSPVNRQRIKRLVRTAADSGTTILMDTRVPINVLGAGAQKAKATPQESLGNFLAEIKADIPDAELIIAYSGDGRDYEGMDVDYGRERLVDAMRQINELGFRAGLSHIQGTQEWFRIAGDVSAETKAVAFFENGLSDEALENMYEYDPNAEMRQFRNFSAGFDIFLQSLIQNIQSHNSDSVLSHSQRTYVMH